MTFDARTGVIRQAQKPSSPSDGLLWYDTQNQVLKQFVNGSFGAVGNTKSFIKSEATKRAIIF